MNSEILKAIKHKVNLLPTNPGVYFMKDEFGNIIYIGKAKNLKSRVSSYFIKTYKPEKVAQMVSRVFTFDYIITNSEFDALNLESNLIKQHQPFYNILLKDSRAHAFFRIDLKKDFPILQITRSVKRDGAKYFGPYFSGVSIRDLFKIMNNAFMLRDATQNQREDRPYKRESLNYFLGKNSAKFTKDIDKQEYAKEVQKVVDFLNGDLDTVREILTEKMQKSSENEHFERAIEYRESLQLLNKLKNKVITELIASKDIDVFGYKSNGYYSAVSVLVVRAGKMIGASNYFVLDSSLTDSETLNNFILQYYSQNSQIPKELITNFEVDQTLLQWLTEQQNGRVTPICPQRGVKKQLLEMANKNADEHLEKNIEKNKLHHLKTIGALEQLQQDLSLSTFPKRMECYDISNMQGTHIVASMVVFINGEPAKKHYRKFKIKTVVGHNDDFLSMNEVLTRRMERLNSDDESFKNCPQLIVIDGGKGQLSSATAVLKEYNALIDIISLAKKHEEVFVPNKPQSILLHKDNYGLKVLQNIRDEAHRFAITFHRSLRNKSTLYSELNNISGVGENTIRKLFEHFKDINKIKRATTAELSEVKGVNKTAAQNIVLYFSQKSSS